MYFELQNAGAVDKELVERIKSKMKELVAEKLPIIYKEVPKDEAIKIIEKHNGGVRKTADAVVFCVM